MFHAERNHGDRTNIITGRRRSLLEVPRAEKFAFLSPRVGRPGKAFLDYASVSKLYPWVKTNIKCSNRKNWHVRGHRYAIPPRQTSPLPPLPIKMLRYCPHVHVACILRTPQQYTVMLCRLEPLRWPSLCMIRILHTGRCRNVCASVHVLLRRGLFCCSGVHVHSALAVV